jgi:cytochrome c553
MTAVIWLAVMIACAAGGLIGVTAASEEEQGTRIENAFRGALQDRSSRSPEERMFVEKCGMCHRQMGMGTVLLARRMDPKQAMLERRTDLTADYVRSAVRHGLGNMPKISRGEVNDAELELISRYLVKNNAAIHSRRWQERAKPVRLELDD